MTKRILAILLAVCCLTACGQQKTTQDGINENNDIIEDDESDLISFPITVDDFTKKVGNIIVNSGAKNVFERTPEEEIKTQDTDSGKVEYKVITYAPNKSCTVSFHANKDTNEIKQVIYSLSNKDIKSDEFKEIFECINSSLSALEGDNLSVAQQELNFSNIKESDVKMYKNNAEYTYIIDGDFAILLIDPIN